jgi:hypothetical protein
MKIKIKCCLSLLSGALAVAIPFTIASCTNDSVIAMTAYGRIRGVDQGGILSFKGVPYAKNPIGELRFAPPRNPDQ